MALVTMKEILKESVEKKYAVGAFDTFNHALTEGIIIGAEKADRPVIMMIVGFLFDQPDHKAFFKYLVDRCEMSSVPIALHLDHGPSFESVMQAIRHGCTSVMIDGSSLPMEENIALTKKVCETAHACGITVEGEIGHVGGHEGDMLGGGVANEALFTRVEDAVRFTEETGVDALAIAVGTVHGVYKGTPKLDYQRLSEIRKAVSIPLVMHGGSGLPAEDFKKSVANGINKINFFTGMSLGAGDAMIKFVEERRSRLHFHEILNVGIEKVSEIVKEQIDVFGTQKLS